MTAEDVRQAVLRLYRAAEDARRISELPAEIGARVYWANGVTWERIGENEWEPFHRPIDGWVPDEEERAAMRAPSVHVASGRIIDSDEP